MDEVRYWIETEGTGHYFFIAFPICLLILFILLKGRKLKFLVPSILISIIIINPWFYKKWDELGLYAYWRILWVIPVIPVIAGIVPAISEKIENARLKVFITSIGIAICIFGGTYLYSGAGGTFVDASNAEKLPEYVVQIADKLLELDGSPRVVFQNPVGTYIRQYSGKIDQLYGRNVDGYILPPSAGARNTYNQVSNGNLREIATFMANNEYDYLVVNPENIEVQLNEYGFELVDYVADFGIYKAHGTPTVVKQYNDLGQVLSVTIIDEDGLPINGEAGYSTILYEYDSNGNISREFHVDVDGRGVADINGRAGFEHEYDENYHLIMEKMLDSDGKAINNSLGYAQVRRSYNGSDMIYEAYFNDQGQLVNRMDFYYASVRYEYDNQHHRIHERYYDKDGNMVISNMGYAHVARRFENNRLVAESYYGIDDNPVFISKGYSAFSRYYDKIGRLLKETYLDIEGRAVNCINGYAIITREYSSDNSIVRECFMDENGKMVITSSGYAEVKQSYTNNKLILEEYFGIDGKPLEQTAGYSAIAQEWNGNVLVSRTYLDASDNPMLRDDGYSKALWTQEENGIWDVHFEDLEGFEVPLDSKNLAMDIKYNSDGWSEWMVPSPNTVDYRFNLGLVNLGKKIEGDVYTCSLEIEFKDVTETPGKQINFCTQGETDGQWITENVWNRSLINLVKAPTDGIYQYESTVIISGEMEKISTFNIGFRCDNWGSGMFRVRRVKIEKGNYVTEWSQGI